MRDKIIEYITRNRVSTTEVSDCLGKSGAVRGVMPCVRGHHKVGEMKLVYAYDETNWPLHEQIANIEEGKVIFVASIDCGNRAIFGELAAKYLLLYRRSIAIVTDGQVRDAAAIIKERYPIWHAGFNPEGCFNTRPARGPEARVIDELRARYDGAVAVCDDCGVVVIPKHALNEDMLHKLEQIELQEDIWFDRLDRHKENTFDIVCLKKYMMEDR